jgi:fluoride exporter
MTKILWLALAGALGTLARAGLTRLVQRAVGLGFPWGTLTVNLVGSLLFGLVWAVTERRLTGAAELRLVFLTGFMGAFTTFSTLVFDTTALIQQERIGAALGNLALQNLLGLICVGVGLWAGRAL